MSRLLTLLLLYQAGYEVGRFISLERLVQESSESYYEALQAAGIAWHTEEHDVTPWLNYLIGIVIAAYKEFESRIGVIAGRDSKREAIRQFVRQSLSDEFTVADVRRAAPAASQSYISKTLAKMRDEVLADHPDLERDDTLAALEFGARAAGRRGVSPLSAT